MRILNSTSLLSRANHKKNSKKVGLCNELYYVQSKLVNYSGPAPQMGVWGRRPPGYRTRPPFYAQKLRNICNPPPLISLSPPHCFISGAGPVIITDYN